LYWTQINEDDNTRSFEGIASVAIDGTNPRLVLDLDAGTTVDLDRNPGALTLIPPLASASQTISSSTGSSPLTFGATGVSIAFNGVSGSGDVTVSRFNDPPLGASLSEQFISQFRIVITAASGLTVGSGTEVRFDTGSFLGIGDPATVQIYSRPSPSDPFATVATSVDGTDLVATVDGVSEFVLASNDAANPLPVEMNGFTVSADDGTAVLQWQTASEANNAGFYVERRTAQEGVWSSIGYELGAGTTAQPQSYRFRDAALPFEAPSVDYRLRQVDLDGTESVLSPVTLQVGTPATLQLHPTSPNPARSQVTVRYELPTSGDARLDVYNVLGQRVRSVDASLGTVGRREITLSTAGMASGVYFVRLTQDGTVQTQRFTVVR